MTPYRKKLYLFFDWANITKVKQLPGLCQDGLKHLQVGSPVDALEHFQKALNWFSEITSGYGG